MKPYKSLYEFTKNPYKGSTDSYIQIRYNTHSFIVTLKKGIAYDGFLISNKLLKSRHIVKDLSYSDFSYFEFYRLPIQVRFVSFDAYPVDYELETYLFKLLSVTSNNYTKIENRAFHHVTFDSHIFFKGIPKVLLTIPEIRKDFENIKVLINGKIYEVGKVTKLDLSGLGLTHIPEGVFKLSNLKWLDLSNNKLTGIPYEIHQLNKLETLNLENNPLTTFPFESKFLPKLDQLFLSNTNLSDYIVNELKTTYRNAEIYTN